MINLSVLYRSAAAAVARSLLTKVVNGQQLAFISVGMNAEDERIAVVSSRGDWYCMIGDIRGVADNYDEYRATAHHRAPYISVPEFMAHCGALVLNVRQVGEHTDLNVVLSDADRAIYENVDGAVALTFDVEKVKEILEQLNLLDEVGCPKNARQAAALGLNPVYF